MTNWINKHKRLILVFILLFIGVPFIFMVPGWDSLNLAGPPDGAPPEVVAQVGSVPVTTREFLQSYDSVVQNMSRSGRNPTAEQLISDGTVDQILESLINDKLLAMETENRRLPIEREYLISKLKEDPTFQTEEGEFDRAMWNQWVETLSERGMNWQSLYEDVERQVNRRIYGELLSASARVTESEIRKRFRENNTTIKVKYATIEPPVELSEEDLKSHYEENKEQYQTPEERVAKFISITLEPPKPDIVDELVERARAGEDFAQLAEDYSAAPSASSGGDLGWVIETADLPEHRQILFDMNVGQVSDAIEGPTGYHIYKVEEERVSPLAGKRDVRAREIVLRPQLDEAERESRQQVAEAVALAAQEDGELESVAEEEGYEVKQTSSFSAQSTEIENVDSADALTFRRALSELEEGAVSDVIEGRKNLYVAKVVEYKEPSQQTFEEAREDVETDAIAAYKRTPEYQAAVQQYVSDIRADAGSLQDITTEFPELDLEIRETKPFSKQDFLFSEGIFWNASEAFEKLKDKDPGAMVGPISDFRQQTHFLQLVEKNEPDQSVWDENWEEARETIRSEILRTQELQRQQDYLQHLREQASSQYMIQEDYAAIARVLGVDDEETGAEPATASGAQQPETETPSEPIEVIAEPGREGAAIDITPSDPVVTPEEADAGTEQTEPPAEEAAETSSPDEETSGTQDEG